MCIRDRVNGTRIDVEGRTEPDAETLRTTFAIHTAPLHMEHFKRYLSDFTPLNLNSGTVALDMLFTLSQPQMCIRDRDSITSKVLGRRGGVFGEGRTTGWRPPDGPYPLTRLRGLRASTATLGAFLKKGSPSPNFLSTQTRKYGPQNP